MALRDRGTEEALTRKRVLPLSSAMTTSPLTCTPRPVATAMEGGRMRCLRRWVEAS